MTMSLHGQLARYRELVMPLLRAAVPRGEPRRHLYDLIDDMLAREGKALRPALCLATCAAFGGNVEEALPSAAALELLHNAFLVHDDLEDASDYRRGQPTLHRQHGTAIAINTGDAMNAMSARLLKQNFMRLRPELCARIFDEFDHLTLETIEGQALELGWIRENDCAVSEDDYLLLVLKKTAWYSFIHPARIGALIARPERSDFSAFDKFGYFLGVAFQIQDDVLNLVGDAARYGKEIGGDLLEGKRTLMLVHLFEYASQAETLRLRNFLDKPRSERLERELVWIYELLTRYGSIEYARATARRFAAAAEQAFAAAYSGATPGPDLDFIRGLVDYVVSRDV